MSEDLTMRECLMRDIHNLQDQRDFAISQIKRLERERNEWRACAENLHQVVDYLCPSLMELDGYSGEKAALRKFERLKEEAE
jgi:hypothetical protein